MPADDFISALRRIHLDNGLMVYYRMKAGDRTAVPVMPATPFIFEYFLYNSIYQHDWNATDKADNLVIHKSKGKGNLRDWEQQEILLAYLKNKCLNRPQLIERAFAPFKFLVDLDGEWTMIAPDHNLDGNSGKKFFSSVRAMQQMLLEGISIDNLDDFFNHLNLCREFVGNVRNNIFHGTKSQNQIHDRDQRRRIELYHLFIQSLNSLFFLTRSGSSKVAADNVFQPIKILFGPQEPLILTPMKVLELHVEGMVRREDSELIVWANERLGSMRNVAQPSGAMFYPSAGRDIITPVLIGLPFCTDFHFYDSGTASGWQKALTHLAKVLGNPRGFRVPCDAQRSFELEFEYAGVKRRIFHVNDDNQDFLKSSSPLIFFFRRGDSQGEGGSDQPWDSAWFDRWKTMVPEGASCAVITDATPYGLAPELEKSLVKIQESPQLSRTRPYYFGIIPPSP